MGLFGKLFEKKECDICGGEIGLLGNRKLEDGNLCKECAKKLSPFFSDRRRSTVDQIREQLEYREANKDRVAALNPTRTLGADMKIIIDEDADAFVVSRSRNWRNENPDVIDFSQVTGCNSDIREDRRELKRRMPDGTEQSYSPPRYDVDYNFYVTIHVNSPYFDEIEIKLNNYTIEDQYSAEFNDMQRQANEIREILTTARQNTRDRAVEAAAPKVARTCPFCGATTTPDASGRCEYCGGAMGA